MSAVEERRYGGRGRRAEAVARHAWVTELHGRLIAEYAGVLQPGAVLARVMRVAHALELSSCPREDLRTTTELLSRTQLDRRG